MVWRSCPRSYALHLSLAKEAVRPDEQHHQHDEVGSDGIEARAQLIREREALTKQMEDGRVLVTGGQLLDKADDQAADHRSKHGVNAAEDDRREGHQGDDAEAGVDA